MRIVQALIPVLVLSFGLLVACGDDTDGGGDEAAGDGDGDGGEGCDELCGAADYDGGTEEAFDGGVTECTCSGAGRELTQQECTDYCSDFEIPEEYSYLSSESGTNDKCVCDGTQL